MDSIQNEFSLVQQEDRLELLPWLHRRGIGYLAYGPLGYGLLTGAVTSETQFAPEDWRSGSAFDVSTYDKLFSPSALAKWSAKIDLMRTIASELEISVASLALRWVVQLRGVSAAIAGSRNARHVWANAEAGEVGLPKSVREELDEVFARERGENLGSGRLKVGQCQPMNGHRK